MIIAPTDTLLYKAVLATLSAFNVLKSYLEENIDLKESAPDISATGMVVLHQQFLLVQAIEEWIASLKENYPR